jgi:DDE family transposase
MTQDKSLTQEQFCNRSKGRGGRSAKIHAIVDSKGRPLNFAVTHGQVHNSRDLGDVLDTPKEPLGITADKAHDSEKVRQQIKHERALPIQASLQCYEERLSSEALNWIKLGLP